jgi:hypothetical protein
MMRIFTFLICLTFGISAFGQGSTREILRGQIVSDSIDAERVTIYNKTSSRGAVSDDLGFFTIYARVSDTLVFSSVNLKPVSLVLTQVDFDVQVMRVKLDVFVNELDEVIVSPRSLSGDLAKDDKNLKVTRIQSDINPLKASDIQIVDDFQSTARNIAMPNDGSIPLGMDFVRMGKDFLRLFRKDKGDAKIDYTSDKVFTELAQERFTYFFFTETLGLQQDEIGLFLNYCESDPKLKGLLSPSKEFELIDFLISKGTEYRKLHPKK